MTKTKRILTRFKTRRKFEIKNDEFKWKVCGDLKVVALLLGM